MSGSRKIETRKGGAKLRFVLLEADVEDGNFGDITQAIVGALRAGSAPQRSLSAASVQRQQIGAIASSDAAPAPGIELDSESPAEDVTDEPESSQASSRVSTPGRRYRAKVKVVDVDFDSPTTFEQFVLRAGSPKEVWKRFLVAAAWFKEHRKLDEITADHVYTCFKRMDWDVVENMSDPLWKLRQKDFGTYSKKVFAINHVGVDKVAKMARENPAA